MGKLRLLGFGLMVLSTPLLGVGPLSPRPVAAGPEACTKYRLIAARGSGDSQEVDDGLGAPGKQMKDQLVSLLGPDLSWSAVQYPAVSIAADNPDDFFNLLGAVLHLKPLGAYTDSVRQGTANAEQQIADYHAMCPATRFILGGFSQGAQAVGDALQHESSLVSAAGFFGDPYFNAQSWSGRGGYSPSYYGALGVRGEWPSSLLGHVFSHCHDGDPVCNISLKVHILGDGDVFVRNPARLDFSNHTDYATLGDGTSAADEIAQALGYPLSQAPLDVMFAIDSTGSMGGAIDTVESNVDELAATLATETSNFQFGLVDYKDDPSDDSPYQARLDIGLTSDLSAFQAAVDSLTAEGGGDTPESVYDGVITAFSQSWRPSASHAVVLIGDAPAKDPEPVTGYTLSSVSSSAVADNAHVFAVQVGANSDTAESFSMIADGTGGQFFPGGFTASAGWVRPLNDGSGASRADSGIHPDDGLLGQLEAALLAAGHHVDAVLGGPYVGNAGTPTDLSAAASTSTAGSITSFAWDFDGDGTIDETTDGPVTSHVYGSAGTFDAVVTVASASASAQASTPVTIGPSTQPPGPPTDLVATGATESVLLSWHSGDGLRASLYDIVDADGNQTTVSADADGNPPASVTIDGLSEDTEYHFSVTAIGQGGGSAFVAFPAVSTAPPATTTTTTTGFTTTTSIFPTTTQSGGEIPRTGSDAATLTPLGVRLITAGCVCLGLSIVVRPHNRGRHARKTRLQRLFG